jgi:hypothetical protein
MLSWSLLAEVEDRLAHGTTTAVAGDAGRLCAQPASSNHAHRGRMGMALTRAMGPYFGKNSSQ